MFKPALAAVLVASCFSANAEDIEHISIYANRTATAEAEVLASVTLLERDDIVARQAADLPALLAQLPGINVARSGGRGQLSSVFIRGGEAKHTLILIDGVRSGSATAGAKSLAMLPLELIERIEIIRGPRAAFYGADAMAGVIAISTRRAEVAEINANAGSNGQIGADVSATYRGDKVNLHATVGTQQADGINAQTNADPDRDGYRQRFTKLSGAYQSRVGQWSAQADVSSGYYQYDNQWGSEDAADTLNRTFILGWQHDIGATQHQAQLSRQRDRDVSFGPQSRSPFQTDRDEFSYQLTSPLTETVSAIGGVNWYQESVAASAPAYLQTARKNRALFSGISVDQAAVSFDAVVRRDLDSQFGGANTWQLAAAYQLNSLWSLRAGRAASFKAPSFNDLYYPGSENPALRPERAIEDEIALRYRDASLTLNLTWFDRNVSDLLQWGNGKMENIAKANIRGVETSADVTLQAFSYSFSYTWLDARDDASKRLARRPEHAAHWRGAYQFTDWSMFVTADYQSKTQQGPFDPLPKLPGFTQWGFGAQFDLSDQLMIRAKIDNLTDKHYQTVAGYNSYGVTANVGISYLLH
ncbi:MAG: TonB-dependent receptor [Gammaproteobacteria bacterium]|nr:TonB-dependent receptor [Gammaproteobacteria bacterium]MBU2184879.1 TonB-dependent receptor [Gammaproteobacteria bacterium]MBU2204415.1 TonB-dependent receptor [Gammaproteobacteria bacterium]